MLKIPHLFAENCVLQRNSKISIFGYCDKNIEVKIQLCQITTHITSNDDGEFIVFFNDLPIGGPYTLKITTENSEEYQNNLVFVGDVFICSGQSNMELPIKRVREKFPIINSTCNRIFIYKPVEDIEFAGPKKYHNNGIWTRCSVDNIEEVSALCYFLGEELETEYNIPIGLIDLSLGGTPIEAWSSDEIIDEEHKLLKETLADTQYANNVLSQYKNDETEWNNEVFRQENLVFDEYERGKINIPFDFEQDLIENFCGCIYLTKNILIEKINCDKAFIRFGTMTESDKFYVNDILVGETGYCYPPRKYDFDSSVLKIGNNKLKIRLLVKFTNGRVTYNKPYYLKIGEEIIDLTGEWEYEIKAKTKPATQMPFLNRTPSVLYNALVTPCLNYKIKGFVWYQGESNGHSGRDKKYEKQLTDFIGNLRKNFDDENLPFFIVQLPNCYIDIPKDLSWANIRQAQLNVGQTLDNVYTIVTLDLGEDNDLHPLDKKGVAHRVATAIKSFDKQIDYGIKIVDTTVLKDRIIIQTNENLFLLSDDLCQEFEGVTIDGDLIKLHVEIKNNEIRINTADLPEIKEIRYAYKNCSKNGLICVKNGNLLSPFKMKA